MNRLYCGDNLQVLREAGQIRTVEQLLAGEAFQYPHANVALTQAERVDKRRPEQGRSV